MREATERRPADEIDAVFTRLSRSPDFDAPELQAHDASDRLLLDTAADAIRAAAPGELAIVGDRHGALTLGAALGLGARGVRTHQDPLLGERALAENARRAQAEGLFRSVTRLDEDLLGGARVVLLQLPRGLDALDEIAWAVATWAAPDATLFAGGRVKHMTPAQNAVLERYFAEVRAGLGRRKSRVLTASRPKRGSDPRFPSWGEDPDLGFRVAAHGATFGGATLDHGSRLLLRGLGWTASAGGTANSPSRGGPAGSFSRIVDLGCGNGVLATAAALANPDAEVIATDQSVAAVQAARLTADAAGVGERVRVVRADGAEAVPDAWADLILLNPPFHSGATVHTEVAHRLIRSCARALAPGGELRIVFNSRLGYRPLVARAIGTTRQVSRDRTFTVLSATRGGS